MEDVEVNEASEHMDAAEASASGNWEALFVPVQIEGRAIEMTDFDLTPTAEELEAMKNEPAYGRPIVYLMSDGCTSGPTMADHLGYYAEAGLTAEGVKGTTDVEGLGTGKVDVASGMMAKMLVPITNGVDITFVGGSHIGCKSLYVLADSEYNTTADLKGQKISTPNGIGMSDYNITALLLDADGINYATDVELVKVTADACVAAMENGEIAAALLSDTFAYAMVKDGKLKCIRSQQDTDFADRTCCVLAMNGTFVKENPTIAKKVAQAVQKAHSWMRDNSAEATQVLMDIANKVNGLDVGTEDLSEFVDGWCTYNGDQMSMYNMSASVPKTLIQHLVRYAGGRLGGEVVPVVEDILDTPISPELIPSKEGELTQRTEDTLGAYALHDFFLYHMMDSGASPLKLYPLAKAAFDGQYADDAILAALRTFVRRFFTQQFKRSAMPDGPKVGSVSLSPRGDWRMPSDAQSILWMQEVEQLERQHP